MFRRVGVALSGVVVVAVVGNEEGEVKRARSHEEEGEEEEGIFAIRNTRTCANQRGAREESGWV
jgi:hypothetical protein